ncbi:TRADD-N-associated membrane domain-containing protein [Mycolicibacterium vaccae]|uniref:TRADD-N-associated membrane domain-containing protein n=1 Tax=Mycolicibacterium vaccae TaxID=1810 RepID=UPI003D079EC0
MGTPASETWASWKSNIKRRRDNFRAHAGNLGDQYRKLSLLVVLLVCLAVGVVALVAPLLLGLHNSQPAWVVVGGVIIFVLFAVAVGDRSEKAVKDGADDLEDQVERETTLPTVEITTEEGTSVRLSDLLSQAQGAAQSSAINQQEAILRRIYAEGLSQASASFRVSITFAMIGAGLLFSGVALAIWRAPDNGQAYASVVSITAGVVINLVSSLFFVQSNRTRKDMAQQGAALREESQEDRRFSGSRELVETIDDAQLRDKVKSQIIVRLMEMGMAEPTSSQSKDAVNDASPRVNQ